ncbi:aquaporin [Pseudofrankia inefficax]|uniref:aquaporin n=1 Tax=Pseudofrankia inefficax (strain DSM 45817 / CECT 9037 / DDB 130130 / EuI1c) TaxID=298654 RepID=UPI0001BFB9D2|nr:aquaporin [Pseudofrankia inefficax]
MIGLATTSGAGFNPVRGLAPDVIAGRYPGIWTFVAGPLAGGALAGGVFRLAHARQPVTGKLRHDPEKPCYLSCDLPHHAARSMNPDSDLVPVEMRSPG